MVQIIVKVRIPVMIIGMVVAVTLGFGLTEIVLGSALGWDDGWLTFAAGALAAATASALLIGQVVVPAMFGVDRWLDRRAVLRKRR